MSSPPFQMEDQTDADFFDKLVDDEFDGSDSAPSFSTPTIESDEVQAFANLTMNEPVPGANVEGKDVTAVAASDDSTHKDILVSEESVSLLPPPTNSIPAGDGTTAANVSFEPTESRGNGSKGRNIKEVQWTLFNADSTQKGVNREGSSEFFTHLGESGADPFADLGDSLKVDPFSISEDNPKVGFDPGFGITGQGHVVTDSTSSNSVVHQEEVYTASTEQATSGQDLYNSQYWENLYPGWRYDSNTGEWVQVEGYDATANTQVSYGETSQAMGNAFVSDQKTEVSYLQQTAQSVVGTVSEDCTTGSVSTWNQLQPGVIEYPPHMVFDPQYPGWYYDTITQEWCTLESYNSAIQSTSAAHGQQHQGWNNSNGGFSSGEHSLYSDGQVDNYSSQDLSGQNHGGSWAGSAGNYSQQNTNMWQPEIAKSDALSDFSEHQKLDRFYGSKEQLQNTQDQHMGFRSVENSFTYEQTSRTHSSNDVVTGFQSFVPSENRSQSFSSHLSELNQKKPSSHDLYASQNSGFYSPQMFQSGPQLSSSVNESRSSAGRPPHALVTFGFGGKLLVMKDCSSFVANSAYGNQESGGSISVHNIMDVVSGQIDTTQTGVGVDYFRTIAQQSYPGPLVGGSAGAKEVSKWIDERIAKCESPYMDYRKGQLLRLLLSLLKIASQNYGKLRSPFGTDPSLKGTDGPEKAVAVLFSSSGVNGAQLSGYGNIHQCLQNLPTEGQLQATALEVENLLVSGKRMEALQCAQEGRFWVYAFQLAADLGDQYYLDTAKQMAHQMLVAGSPLKTLSLLMAGQPADIFSVDNSNRGGVPSGVSMSQSQTQTGSNGMLDDWERNLAVITANRTKGDELVILHLGDCLWKERGENIAAHMCYLLSEAPFESFSDGARLCLIGADHWKFPRTYASPEAIQRTEFYEYSMVLGNSQSVLLPFQPYKLIYAYMLAEVGRLSDSLKYCQATLKSLKTNRAPEVDAWKQLLSSLEDRIRAHQQSGFGTNLAPRKLVGKFLPFIDSTIHRMIGPPPPPVPSGNASEYDSHPVAPRVANSQSTMAMQSLIPSASMEPISAWGNGGKSMHNRSISEPDFGRSPRQVDSSKEASASDNQGKASDSGGPSRFGRFGSSLIQKTMGWVSRSSRSDRQAKLGEKNKFYYDEKLKRWVEEGAELPAQEAAPPPPPTAASFQNGMQDYNIRNAFKGDSSPANGGAEKKSPSSSERGAGIPPIPPGSNQFSGRSRMGVRSRYVDTFNKGGGAASSFSAPSVVAAKPAGAANAKFFIPTPTSSGEQTAEATSKNVQEDVATKQDPSAYMSKESFSSPSPPPTSMQRFPSMNNITPTGSQGTGAFDNGNGSLSSRSRRTASWSGSLPGALNAPKVNETRPLGEALGMSPLSSIPSNPSTMHTPTNGGNFGDDLHEVEL